MTRCAKDGSEGAAPHIREIYAFWDTIPCLTLPYLFFLEKLQLDAAQWLKKDAVWFKEVPFEVGITTKSR